MIREASVPQLLPLLDRSEVTPFMADWVAPPLNGRAFPRVRIASASQDQLHLLGVMEAPTRDVRLIVVGINGQILQGRAGDVLGGRYRVGEFTDREADLIDIANDEPVHIAASINERLPEVRPAPLPTGALRVVGEPAAAEIYVDGVYVGTVADLGSAPGVPLESGAHDIDLQAPDHQSVRVAVRISPNRTTTYRLALPKER